jgi:FAD/FMN-containing dehydrogenase
MGATLLGARPAAAAAVPWAQLDNLLTGDLIRPSDAAYATAKLAELGNFDAINPAAIAFCVNEADVGVCLKFAQDNDLKTSVRSGGHSYGGYSTTTGLIIDVSRLSQVTVSGGTVLLGPGAENTKILSTLSPLGLQLSEGGCPTVASGGFLQGGGAGYLTPSVGMACDNVLSARVVLANGAAVTASPQQNPDLYWAIRGGGGGNFGVVTSFQTRPAAYGGLQVTLMGFPYDRAVEVLDGVSHWLETNPRIGGGVYVIQPDAAAGSIPMVNSIFVSTGSAASHQAQMNQVLAATGAPAFRQDNVQSYQDLMLWTFSQSGTARATFGLERTRLGSHAYTTSGWDAAMSSFDSLPQAGQTRQMDLHFFGGAANDVARTATAYVHRDSLFTVDYRTTIYDPANANLLSKDDSITEVRYSLRTLYM